MVKKITYIESKDTYPYQNLAVEEYLLYHCNKDECILYLWQNKNTVVIGRNQNIWKECLVDKLREEKGYLVRRLSGGGAVYHDLGNLNFTFLVRKENYCVEQQLNVILSAVKRLGICAESSGRNDILIDGYKFSGNAFYEQGEYCYHHGTLMVNVDLRKLSFYLTVSKDKLKSKGIDSVKARVTNLINYKPGLSIEEVKKKLLEAFEEVYGLKAEVLQVEELDKDEMKERCRRFALWDWIYGHKLEFQHEISNRFRWGQIVLQFQVRNGRVQDVNIFSDSLKSELIKRIGEYLKGIPYSKNKICDVLRGYLPVEEEEQKIINEIISWLEQIEL